MKKKNDSKKVLKFQKFQIAKIENPSNIFGGVNTNMNNDDPECSAVMTKGTIAQSNK